MLVEGNREANARREPLERQLDNLNSMVAYCENPFDCRRQCLLAYLGELDFDPAHCRKTCDNCQARTGACRMEDFTELAKRAIETVHAVKEAFSLAHVADVLKGSLAAKVKQNAHQNLPTHGAAKALTKAVVERLLKRLVLERFLIEQTHRSESEFAYGSITSVLRVDERRAEALFRGQTKFELQCAVPASKAKAAPSRRAAKPPPVAALPAMDHSDSDSDGDLPPAMGGPLHPALRTPARAAPRAAAAAAGGNGGSGGSGGVASAIPQLGEPTVAASQDSAGGSQKETLVSEMCAPGPPRLALFSIKSLLPL